MLNGIRLQDEVFAVVRSCERKKINSDPIKICSVVGKCVKIVLEGVRSS